MPHPAPETRPTPAPSNPASLAPIHLIPLAEIDDAALTRDRTGLDPEPLAELQSSIAASGLRQPIELWTLSQPRGPHRYGLISGFRRLHAFRAQHELTGQDRYAAIPAFLRAPASIAAALTAMVEENEIRAGLSPFERGMVAVTARDQGVFGSIEEAVDALFPNASRQKKGRLRSLALLAEEIGGLLSAPEQLSQQQCLRLARAATAGFADLMRTALDESSLKDPAHQWALLQPILAEADANDATPERSARPGRPRRVLQPRYGLTVRRERTRDGWSLHFTGREATGPLMDLVLDEVERMYSPR